MSPLNVSKEDILKKEFYEKITEIYDNKPNNTVRIVTGNFNAKIRRETINRHTIELHSAHEQIRNK